MNTDKIIQALLKEFKNLEDTDTSGWKQPQSIQEVLTANVASVIALVTQYHDGVIVKSGVWPHSQAACWCC